MFGRQKMSVSILLSLAVDRGRAFEGGESTDGCPENPPTTSTLVTERQNIFLVGVGSVYAGRRRVTKNVLLEVVRSE